MHEEGIKEQTIHKIYLDRELQLIVKFTDKQIVAKSFSHFHDSYYCSINLILSVLENTLFSCFLFFILAMDKKDMIKVICDQVKCHTCRSITYSFLHLNLIDFYSTQFVSELGIISKYVIILNFPPSWCLLEDTGLATGKRLKSSSQFAILNFERYTDIQEHVTEKQYLVIKQKKKRTKNN